MVDADYNAPPDAVLQARVRGRVQGVGFRVFVRDVALELGVSGFVQNLVDGSVYVVASGRREALEELLVMLQRGPHGARVTDVQHEWQHGHTSQHYSGFEVRH